MKMIVVFEWLLTNKIVGIGKLLLVVKLIFIVLSTYKSINSYLP